MPLMTRRKKYGWESDVYSLRAGTRKPIHYSSPNLVGSSSRAILSDSDDDDYGFLARKPPIPPPSIPTIPLEYQESYQKRLKEQRNQEYWENIKTQLYDYYTHDTNNSKQRMSGGNRSGGVYSGITTNNNPMETATNVATKANANKHSTSQSKYQWNQKNKQNPTTQSVPVQSSFGLDDNWIASRRKDSGSTSDLLDQYCVEEDCCGRLEDFTEDLQDLESSRKFCVKCLVRFFNVGQSTSMMSRVSALNS